MSDKINGEQNENIEAAENAAAEENVVTAVADVNTETGAAAEADEISAETEDTAKKIRRRLNRKRK